MAIFILAVATLVIMVILIYTKREIIAQDIEEVCYNGQIKASMRIEKTCEELSAADKNGIEKV